jgi:hypothetical protein
LCENQFGGDANSIFFSSSCGGCHPHGVAQKKDHSRKYNCMTSSLARSPYYSHCGSYSTNFPAAFVGAGGTFLLAMSELLAACNRREFPLGERLPDGCSSTISGFIVGVEYQSEIFS